MSRNNDVTSCCNITFCSVTDSPSFNLHHTWRRAVKGCNNKHIYCLVPETKNLVCRNYKTCGRANTVRLCSPDFNTTRSMQTQEQQVLRRNGQNTQHSATCARTTNRNVRGASWYRVGSALRLNRVVCAPTAESVEKSYKRQHNTLCCSDAQNVNMWQPVSSMSAQSSSNSSWYKNRGLRPKLNPVFLKAHNLAQNKIKDAN